MRQVLQCATSFGTSGHGRSPTTSSKLPSLIRNAFVAARGLVSCRFWAPGHVVLQCSCNICISGRRRSFRMRLSAWSCGGFFGSGVPLATEFLGGFKWGDVTHRFRWDNPALALCPHLCVESVPATVWAEVQPIHHGLE